MRKYWLRNWWTSQGACLFLQFSTSPHLHLLQLFTLPGLLLFSPSLLFLPLPTFLSSLPLPFFSPLSSFSSLPLPTFLSSFSLLFLFSLSSLFLLPRFLPYLYLFPLSSQTRRSPGIWWQARQHTPLVWEGLQCPEETPEDHRGGTCCTLVESLLSLVYTRG